MLPEKRKKLKITSISNIVMILVIIVMVRQILVDFPLNVLTVIPMEVKH